MYRNNNRISLDGLFHIRSGRNESYFFVTSNCSFSSIFSCRRQIIPVPSLISSNLIVFSINLVPMFFDLNSGLIYIPSSGSYLPLSYTDLHSKQAFGELHLKGSLGQGFEVIVLYNLFFPLRLTFPPHSTKFAKAGIRIRLIIRLC